MTIRQGLRRYVETASCERTRWSFFVAQNVALDGYPPAGYETITRRRAVVPGGTPVAMLTQFMTDWSDREPEVVDATVEDRRGRSPPRTRSCSAGSPLARPPPRRDAAGGDRPRAATSDLKSSSSSTPRRPRPASRPEEEPMSTVFIALQTNEDTRPIIEAIMATTPRAIANEQLAMVKIDAEGPPGGARPDHRGADRS